jgi:catechol 2,3-dioxygenase-like lactoylglutathione lyase family enzyme
MSAKPTFRKVLQVGLVVRDSEATARRYWDEFGIGPWRFYTLDPSNTPGMTFRGKPVEHAFRAALANVGDVTLELIEPLSGLSVYAEHLATRGEGLHHLAFAVDNYESARDYLKSRGYDELQHGRPFDINDYSYFDTGRTLRFITELCSEETPGRPFPPPERTVPPAADGQRSPA